MLNNLIHYWREYEAAMKAANYQPDKVQALGMRFYDEWKRNTDKILQELFKEYRLSIDPEKFDYSDHRWVMLKLDKERQPLPEPCKLC